MKNISAPRLFTGRQKPRIAKRIKSTHPVSAICLLISVFFLFASSPLSAQTPVVVGPPGALGAVKLDTGVTCDGTTVGSIAYNSSKIQWCNGSVWADLAAPDCTNDATATCLLNSTRANGDPQFTAANIANGINILGVTGTLTGGGGGTPSCTPSVNNFQYVDTNSSSSTYTLSNYAVPSLSDRTLVVTVHVEDSVGNDSPASVTFNGVNLTLAANRSFSDVNSSVWYLTNPAVTTANIVVSFSPASVSERATVAASTLDCTNQNPSLVTFTSVSGSSPTNTSITTTFDQSVVVDAYTENAGTLPSITQGPDQVLLRSAILGGNTSYGTSYRIVPTAGSATLGWSQSSPSGHPHVLVAFGPKMTGGSTPSCTNDSSVECILEAARANDDADFIAANIRTGKNILNITGSLADCANDATGECILNATRATSDGQFTAANIANGINILGVTGTLTGGSGDPAACVMTGKAAHGYGNFANHVFADGTHIFGSDEDLQIYAFTFNGTTWTDKGASTILTGQQIEKIWAGGGYVYAAAGTTGVHALSFDGTTWAFKATVNTAGTAHAVWSDGTYIYVADDTTGVHAYTFNGTSWSGATTFNTTGTARDVWGDGTYIYVADGSNGIVALTFNGTWAYATGAEATSTKKSSPTVNAVGVHGAAGYVYVLDSSTNRGVHALSFNGTAWTHITSHPLYNSANETIYASGSVVYTTGFHAGVRAFYFNGTTLTQNNAHAIDGAGVYGALTGDATHIYYADPWTGIIPVTKCVPGSGASAPTCTNDATGICTLDSTRANGDPQFTAANIASGVNILGVTGTYTSPAIACPAAGAGADVTSGLIHRWAFDENTGTNAANSVGSQAGTLTSGAGWTSGVYGSAVSLDGTNDYVSLGTMDVSGSAMSLFIWYKADMITDNQERLLAKAWTGAENDHWWMINMEPAPRIRFKAGGSTVTKYGNDTNPPYMATNQWQLIGFTYDGSTLKIYLDGVLIGSTAKTGAINTDSGVAVAIGRNGSDASNGYFDGTVDDMRIYDRALTGTEVTDLYNHGNTALCN